MSDRDRKRRPAELTEKESPMMPSNRFRFALLTALCCLGVFIASAGTASAEFGLVPGEFSVTTTDTDGNTQAQAGARTDVTTTFSLNMTEDAEGRAVPDGDVRDVRLQLPPGALGDPNATPKCPTYLFNQGFGACPTATQVGRAITYLQAQPGTELIPYESPILNLRQEAGKPALFGYKIFATNIIINFKVRSEGDYGLTATLHNIPTGLPFSKSVVDFWGVPQDPSHDLERFEPGALYPGSPAGSGNPLPSLDPPRAVLSNPTSCDGPLPVKIEVRSWQDPNRWVSESSELPANTGCNQVEFNPTVEARPTTNNADSPSGFDFTMRVPQSRDPDGLATAHLRHATVTLPEGMTLNPASAAGLGSCTPAQVGLTTAVGDPVAKFSNAPNTCPNESKLGTVRFDAPAVDQPLFGSIYLATPHQNPFGSLLGVYFVIEDADSGLTIKLAGQPVPDPRTGQLRFEFNHNPQVPFEYLRANFYSGPRAALKTPLSCGNYTTTTDLTPWSAPEAADAHPSDTFAIDKGAAGAPCVSRDDQAPNSPSLTAGTVDPAAGAFTPLVLKLTRPDGTQPVKAIDATLPKGLLGRLVGVSYCSDGALAAAAGKTGKDEQSSPSCPLGSQLGSVTVGSGAGAAPVYVGGKAYLAGPYKGAPLSMAIVTPVLAGPFDLGTVVVRTALNIDPETAQIHAVSDELPTILQGIPLDIRSVAISLDRPQFTLNPTSCDPTKVAAGVVSVFGQGASLSSPFQVGGCKALGFKPKLKIDLRGGTKRSRYPALKATMTARPGDANIARAVVSLPRSEFLAQNHIKTICTRVQFAANACPAGSIYGRATAWSPLLAQPLSGPVYLRSSNNPLPDLIADLNGQIRVHLVGRIDSVNEGIRTSFEAVPDAPVSKFVIEMAGGKKGLLENSRNLCNSVNKASVQMDGQNGKTHDTTPVVRAIGCKQAKKKQKKAGKAKQGKRG